MRVEFTDDAREQVRAASAWWRENRRAAPSLFEDELAEAIALLESGPLLDRRAAPSLFEDELAEAIALLESGPLLARVFDEIGGKVVRRSRLPRTRYALYFTVGDELVTVHALWHGSRRSGPPLR